MLTRTRQLKISLLDLRSQNHLQLEVEGPFGEGLGHSKCKYVNSESSVSFDCVDSSLLETVHLSSDNCSSPEIDFSSHIDVYSLSGNKDCDGNSINSVSDSSTDSTALYSDTSISTDYDGDSIISVSDASTDSTRLYTLVVAI